MEDPVRTSTPRQARAILLAVDGSDGARAAAQVAADVSERTGLALHVVHAWQDMETLLPSAPAIGLGRWSSDLLHEAEAILAYAVTALQAQGVVVAGSHLRQGRPMDAVQEVADETSAGLVVVGSSGAGPLARLIFGTGSRGIIETSGCAVMVMRGGEERWPPKAVVVGDDGSEEAGAAATMGHVLASAMAVPLTLVRSYPPRLARAATSSSPEGEVLAAIERELELRSLAVDADKASLRPGDPAQILLEEAEASRSLIVVGRRGRGAISRLAAGSVSSKVMHACNGPFVVVPSGALPLPSP
jgi:nucleotide-binding universal stress UspA family protein